jgi:tripartite ATP-independent transporter DctP family solute receptor
MMLKKFRCLALLMVLVLVFVSCATFAAAKKPIKLVFGTVYASDHFYVKGDLYFKKLVEQKSKGQIIIDYYPNSQIGGNTEMTDATRSGAQQILLASPGGLTQYWKKMATFELPYVFRDDKHQLAAVKKMTSLIDQDELGAKTNLRILSVRIRSPRHTTSKIPINKVEDLKGLKIRVPENPMNVAIFKNFGAIPTVIPAADTYTALATGVVDGQENPFDFIYTMKWYEQQKYCALTGHIRELNLMMINNKCWNSLTKKQKIILSDAAAQSAEMGIKDAIESNAEYKKLLEKNGMKFTTPDLVPFREKAKKVWEQYGDQELLRKIEAIK